VVEQWCRLCHLRAGDPPDPVMAPRFEEIVRRDGRDEAYFTRFLKEDHFPMTTYRLFDTEKADVVAWLLALQKDADEKLKQVRVSGAFRAAQSLNLDVSQCGVSRRMVVSFHRVKNWRNPINDRFRDCNLA
jgi:hypothetical protein